MPSTRLPAAALVKVPLSLRGFCDMVGQAAFAAWQDSDVTSLSLRLDQRPSDTPTVRRWFVAEQVLLALQTGVIRAGIRLGRESAPLIVRRREGIIEDPASGRRYFRDLNDEGDRPEDLEPLDDPGIQIIHRHYWCDPANLVATNIHLSYCEVPLPFIHQLSARGIYEPIIDTDPPNQGSSKFCGEVFIIDALRALRLMYSYKPVPDKQWFERYRQYQSRILDEVVAAAWRYIAVSDLKDERGRNEHIMRAMRQYLTSQGLTQAGGVSEKVLEVLARKIVRQWRAEETTTLVLLNSTPSQPERARKKKS
ncbi:hypothetical protein [Methylobacterium sp. R2-1]|uniref:hypothetical protein n=1 Tax=Methylobacterium sp. R2-1 TaxID=2587064 RepID=UPI001614561C|nr:hypothetical protein [Methylobacterium sp. R2-1]MBB2962524.1 hypothetical protein [Methylobacterium sp. R2-1]